MNNNLTDNKLLGLVFANNIVFVFMYSLCGLDLGGLVVGCVCMQARALLCWEGDRAHRNIAKLCLPLHYPTDDAIRSPTYLLLIPKTR